MFGMEKEWELSRLSRPINLLKTLFLLCPIGGNFCGP